uniref:Uncharacterized protein n=1 Tax=Tanacetum cinerariifolium TaxID=118510 RepID=A0A6L2MTZ3_TANCI|nr:hypothetical protein [Tanacetum cinerariifolium]
MEALIVDKNAMDKGVADTIQDHKKRHDDEDPSAGPNQGKKTKRRRTKESESSKKPSSTKETPAGKLYLKAPKLGERRKLWYRSQLNKFYKHNVYSTKKILGVKSVSVKKLHRYGHLEEIVVKRADCQLYKFKEGDFVDLHMNEIEDMLLLAKSRRQETCRGFVLGVESYQKKLNITPPQQTVPEIEFKEPYTPFHKPPGVIYEDLVQLKRVIRADDLYKFSDRSLKKVRDELHHRVLDFDLGYNKEIERRKWMATDKKRSALMVELIDK